MEGKGEETYPREKLDYQGGQERDREESATTSCQPSYICTPSGEERRIENGKPIVK
jgi:hypothetical protein